MAEIAGTVMDNIVYDKSSPFESRFFQATDILLDNFENKGRILIGKDQKSSVVVDIDNVVINLASDNFDEAVTKIKSEIIPFFKKIFKDFKIENTNRVGMVFEFKFPNTEQINEIVNVMTKSTFTKAEYFDLRFSQKDTDQLSSIKKELLDYANSIILISKIKDDIIVKFDYQFYYSPEINSINDVDFDKFIETATSALEKKLFKWFEKTDEKQGKS